MHHIDAVGRDLGVTATALFASWSTPVQRAILESCVRRFDCAYVMLDSDVISRTRSLANELGCKVVRLNAPHKDVGSLSLASVRWLLLTMLANDTSDHLTWPRPPEDVCQSSQ